MRAKRLNTNQKQLFKVVQNIYVYILYDTSTYKKSTCSFKTEIPFLMLIVIALMTLRTLTNTFYLEEIEAVKRLFIDVSLFILT